MCAAGFLFISSGCESNNGKNSTDVDKNNLSVGVMGLDDLKRKINNREGKILFINFWATWCKPCVDEFPALVKLAENNKNNDVEFLSLSVDLIKEINSNVIPFIEKQKVNFPVFVIPEKESDEVIGFISEEWNGAIPATAIYDTQGKLVEFITGAETYESFQQKIEKILNQ